jgi:hypothetical protein
MVSVVELAIEVSARPVGSAPDEIAQVPAVATVNVLEVYAVFTKIGLVKGLGAMPVTTSV